MAVNEDLLIYIHDQLADSGEVEAKKMFGGIGFFKEGIMFAMIGYNAFRMRVDETNQANFESRGMKPFQSDSKKKWMPYWEVPTEIIEDRAELAKWAQKALDAAIRGKN